MTRNHDNTSPQPTQHRSWAIHSGVVLHHLGNIYRGICKDLSATKLKIETEQAFSADDEVVISIERKRSLHLPFKVTARVLDSALGFGNNHVVSLAIQEVHA